MYQISFQEEKYHWKMLLVTHPTNPKGPFWYLPHDNENASFSAAVYATKRYGGGFLAVMANDKRFFMGQDPNRNFGTDAKTTQICTGQKYPAPKYSRVVFAIIDHYRASGMPYLALHNNKDGWHGNGGSGGVSILKSSKTVHSYPASRHITTESKELQDEDSLVYIAGKSSKPDKKKLNALLKAGLNTKYEIVNSQRNDCSMSNYVVLKKQSTDYLNIETEHGQAATQKKMIDRAMRIIQAKR